MKKLIPVLLSLLMALAMTATALAATVYTEGALHYTIADESITITGYFGKDAAVTVPASIAGIPVNTIAKGAFTDNDNVKTVDLPDTITAVEEGAFASGITVNYTGSGSSAGVTGAQDGTCDIGLASRDLKDDETGVKAITVAKDGIAIIVNPNNPVADLSVEQIAQLATGEITNWADVGGTDGQVVFMGREAGSGTRDGFESITGTKDACKLDQELTSTGGVIEAVAGNVNAIGYASLSAVEGKDTVKAVTVGGIACTEETVLDGSYAIQRPFVLVTVEGRALSECAQKFFEYITSSEAASLISAAGAVAAN